MQEEGNVNVSRSCWTIQQSNSAQPLAFQPVLFFVFIFVGLDSCLLLYSSLVETETQKPLLSRLAWWHSVWLVWRADQL